MKKLLIDDYEVDIGEDTLIALSKESNDFFDFQNKRSNLSNTIRLPASNRNNQIFGRANRITSSGVNRNFYSATFVQDYTEIISKGRAKLLNSKNGYELAIYWGNINLVDIVKDDTIRDLDLSDLNHDYTLTNIINPDKDGDLIYPLFNPLISERLPLGAVGSKLDAALFFPFVSLKRILAQIQEDYDLTFEGEGVQSLLLTGNDLYIPVNERRDLSFSLNPVNERLRTFPGIPIPVGNTETGILDLFFDIDGDAVNEFEIEQAGEFFVTSKLSMNFNANSDTAVAGHNKRMSYSLFFIMYAEFFDDSTSTWDNYADLTEINAAISAGELLHKIIDFSQPLTAESNIDYLLDASLESVKEFGANDKIRWKFYYDIKDFSEAEIEAMFFVFSHSINSQFDIGFTLRRFGWEYLIAENMPPLPIIEILKYVAANTASLMDIEDGTNNVRFRSIGEFINNVDEAQDISHLVQSIKIIDLHSKLAQENYMMYDNSDDVPVNRGEGLFVIDDNTLIRDMSFYKAPFAASNNQSWNDILIANIPLIDEWNDALKNVGARILQVFNINREIHIEDDTTTEVLTEIPAVQFTPSQSWQSIIEQSWSDYVDVQNNYKQCEAIINMNSNFFKQLDLLRPVFIQQVSAYFLVNKVEDWVKGELTTLILTQLQTTQPFEFVPVFPPPPPPPDITDALLLETPFEDQPILLEDGQYIKLES